MYIITFRSRRCDVLRRAPSSDFKRFTNQSNASQGPSKPIVSLVNSHCSHNIPYCITKKHENTDITQLAMHCGRELSNGRLPRPRDPKSPVWQSLTHLRLLHFAPLDASHPILFEMAQKTEPQFSIEQLEDVRLLDFLSPP